MSFQGIDGNCMNCCQETQVDSADDIEPGDHVTFHHFLYNHHGIIVSKSGDSFEIIEASKSGFFFEIAIQASWKRFDFHREKIYVLHYRKRYSKEETVRRARREFHDSEKKGYNYHFFENNCEHFATYCVTGQKISIQVNTWKMFLDEPIKIFAFAMGIHAMYGEMPEIALVERIFQRKVMCEKCYEILMGICKVKGIPIKKICDIEKGDIIRYETSEDKHHDAVVLEIKERTRFKVKCLIMHYAFAQSPSERTIKSELINVELNGNFFKLDYGTCPGCEVFKPDTVVLRAKKNENEKSFDYDTNNSRTFARWCKLKSPATRP